MTTVATKAKQSWKLGDTGWEVDWCYYLPMLDDDPDTFDRDNARHKQRLFRDKDAAWAFAREIYPADQFGCVMITLFVIELQYGTDGERNDFNGGMTGRWVFPY